MASLFRDHRRRLEAAYQLYLLPDAHARIQQALAFAAWAHRHQRRKSGEHFIIHPLTVATYMAQAYMDEDTLIAALLHDVAEDTDYSLEDIEARFGANVRHLVDGVTHLKNVSQLEDIAHMFDAIASDVRVVLIKLYDRLHNMQTLDAMTPERQQRKAQETLDIYVPLAAKFGIWELKNELETLILRYLDPLAHAQICNSLAQNAAAHLDRMHEIELELQTLLRGYGIPCTSYIDQRHPFNLYRNKVQPGSNQFQRTLRINLQFNDVPACYQALGYIHQRFAHLSRRFADHIGNPRDIFYQSIHTTIMVPRYSPVDLRLRTYQQDRSARIGVIAQLQFAPPGGEKPSEVSILPQVQALRGEVPEAQRFVESVFKDILQKHIICFTPRGKEIALPHGATVLDFAYRVHTDIGHECRGGIVNGNPVEVKYVLHDGDHVEILRQRGGSPSLEWLDETLGYTLTDYARRKVREWLRRRDTATLIRHGREVLHHARRTYNVMHITAQILAKDFHYDSTQTLYLNIGNGSLTISNVIRKLLNYVPDLLLHSERNYVTLIDHQGRDGRIAWLPHQPLQLAQCCNPQVGQPVVGYVQSRHSPVKVHAASCINVLKTSRLEHLVKLSWEVANVPVYTLYIYVEGYDRGGLLRDMSTAIANAQANILRVDTLTNEVIAEMRFQVELSDPDQLIRVMHEIETLQNVSCVRRLDHAEVKKDKAKGGAAC